MRVDFQLLDRLRREHRRQTALAGGLRTQCNDLELHRRTLNGNLSAARRRAEGMGASPRRSTESDEDFRERLNAEDNAKAEARSRLIERFRGHDPALLGEQLAALERPDASHYEAALRLAQEALAGCDAELADLQKIAGEAGSQAGRLRATIQTAEAFFARNPHLLEESVEEAAE